MGYCFDIHTVRAMIQVAKGIQKEPHLKPYYCEVCTVQSRTVRGLSALERNIDTGRKQF